MEKEDKSILIDENLVESIKSIILSVRKNVSYKINKELILTYWRIGKEIVESEQKNGIDSQTSRQIILNLSKLLTNEVGKGFSRSNLFNMRKFFLEYSDVQSLTGHLPDKQKLIEKVENILNGNAVT